MLDMFPNLFGAALIGQVSVPIVLHHEPDADSGELRESDNGLLRAYPHPIGPVVLVDVRRDYYYATARGYTDLLGEVF